MTRQEAAEVLEELTKPGRLTILAPGGVYDAIKMAIDALGKDKGVPSKDGDLIYRQDAIHVVSGLDSSFVKYIEELPSVQPKPLTEAEVVICKLYLDDLDKYKSCNEYKLLMGLLDGTASAQPERKWIPCSERLPEDTVIVTAETKTCKHKYACEAVWIPRWSKKAEYDNWEDCSEYNEDEDEYYVLEGWYERVHNWDEYSFVGIEDDVIAWMPLPKVYGGEPGIGRAND